MTDEKLMQYLDGELSPAESREVERELAAAPVLRKKRDALLEMRDLLKARFELAESDVEPELGGLWERVRSGLPSAPVVPVRPGFFVRMRDWLETYRAHFVTGAVAAAAGALVATFVTSRIAATVPHAPAASPQTAEVESLEVLGGSGMVFEEPPSSQTDSGTTVIWVSSNEDNDDDTAEEAPL